MKLCIVSEGYPSINGDDFVFVEQLCMELSRQGHEITVIAPQSLTKIFYRGNKLVPFKRTEIKDGANVTVYSPLYISLSNLTGKIKLLGKLKSIAIEKVIKSFSFNPDVIYCHSWNRGYEVFEMAKKMSVPLFVATGESEIRGNLNIKKKSDFTSYVKGVISVSNKNLRESNEKGFLKNQIPYAVVPNAVNNNLFKKLSKQECRKMLNIPPDAFIVIFVGCFIYRKGADRVSAAISKLNDPDIKSIFIGKALTKKSAVMPTCDGILHKGPVNHEDIPYYLNASDVFVLPSLNEGSCNAIVEAMACGLPIISSDKDFNRDILDDTNSILIDPLNVDEIANAIKTLKSDKVLRDKMGESSLKKAEKMTLYRRAKKIISFIRQNIT